jgi:RNA polymerase sigma factor (TIGR02999 family)
MKPTPVTSFSFFWSFPMAPEPDDRITTLLEQVRDGSNEARNELVAVIYDRFRQRAYVRLRDHERPGHTLGASDLTNEALVRLLQNDELAKATNRNQLFRAFTRAMRQVLIDHARRRAADKRGGARQREELDDLADEVRRRSQIDLLSLHEALDTLARDHPREAEVLQMRFFGGCEMAEIAEALGVSLSSVERDSRFGQAWLRDFLSSEGVS